MRAVLKFHMRKISTWRVASAAQCDHWLASECSIITFNHTDTNFLIDRSIPSWQSAQTARRQWVPSKAPDTIKRMADAASAFLASLGKPELAKATFPFAGTERYEWHYTPVDRNGLLISEDERQPDRSGVQDDGDRLQCERVRDGSADHPA